MKNKYFGVCINYQLIELFNILKKSKSEKEFNILKNNYLKKEEIIFPGILECKYKEAKNIYKNLIRKCNTVTPEVEAKMKLTINNNVKLFNKDNTINLDVFNFSYLDKIIAFAKEHNMKVRLHTLIFHKHFPKVLNNCSKSQIIEFLDTYFKTIRNRYDASIFYSIDVLNEIVADINREEFKNNSILRVSKWKEKLGDDYYLVVLKLVRKYFPNTPLVYNEYDEFNDEKRKRILLIINNIIEEEEITNIKLLDAIGLQSHYHEYITDDEIKRCFEDFSKTKKEMQITEMDIIRINKNNSNIKRILKAVLKYSKIYNINSFTFWGVSSSISWKAKNVVNFLNDKGKIDKNCKNLVRMYTKL